MVRKRELDPIEINEIQKEIALYFDQQFPERYKSHRRHIPLYKAVEALGEMSSSLWTERTERSHAPEVEEEIQKQALGRAVVFLIEYAARHSWDAENIVREVWELMHGEDWDPYPNVGRPRLEENSTTE